MIFLICPTETVNQKYFCQLFCYIVNADYGIIAEERLKLIK